MPSENPHLHNKVSQFTLQKAHHPDVILRFFRIDRATTSAPQPRRQLPEFVSVTYQKPEPHRRSYLPLRSRRTIVFLPALGPPQIQHWEPDRPFPIRVPVRRQGFQRAQELWWDPSYRRGPNLWNTP